MLTTGNARLDRIVEVVVAQANATIFLAEPVRTEGDRAGVIQAFEFTFEIVWKLMKHLADREGLSADSPRRALVAGYKLGVIGDETLWLDMLADRHSTSHVYHHQVAERIFLAVEHRYAPALARAVAMVRAALTAAPP